MKMAGFAVAIAVLTSCAGGGNIEGPASPSRSASELPTPTVSVPTSTRSAPRPEIPSPTPTKPSPALSSSRPTEEPTRPQEPTSTPSATKNPSRSPILEETTKTQTVTAAPSPSTVTRSVTISPSPTGLADCKPVAVLVRGGRVCRNQRSFLVLVGAGGFIACSRGSDAPSGAGTPSTSLEG